MEIVLFDLGRTLLYFDGTWPQALAFAGQALVGRLKQSGLQLDEDAFLEGFNTSQQAYAQERETEFIEFTSLFILKEQLKLSGYESVDNSILQAALNDMYAVTQAFWRPEDDALPTIRELVQRGYRLGIISNASDDNDVQQLVDKIGARPYFDIIISSAAVGIRKPNPEIFYLALRHWNAQPEQAVMVGDTLGADILGAHNSGMPGIWITRRADTPGNRAHLDTIQPDLTIATLAELPDVLENIGNNK